MSDQIEEKFKNLDSVRQECVEGMIILEEKIQEMDVDVGLPPKVYEIFIKFKEMAQEEAELLSGLAGIGDNKLTPNIDLIQNPINVVFNLITRCLGFTKPPIKTLPSSPSPVSIMRMEAFNRIVLLGEHDGYLSLLPIRMQLEPRYDFTISHKTISVYMEMKKQLLRDYRNLLEEALLKGLVGVDIDADEGIRERFLSVIDNFQYTDIIRIKELLLNSLVGLESERVFRLKQLLNQKGIRPE